MKPSRPAMSLKPAVGMQFCHGHGREHPTTEFRTKFSSFCIEFLETEAAKRAERAAVSKAEKANDPERPKYCRGHFRDHPLSAFASKFSNYCEAYAKELADQRSCREDALRKKARDRRKPSRGSPESDSQEGDESEIPTSPPEDESREVLELDDEFPVYYNRKREHFCHLDCDGALAYLNQDKGIAHFQCRTCRRYLSATLEQLAHMAGVPIMSGS